MEKLDPRVSAISEVLQELEKPRRYKHFEINQDRITWTDTTTFEEWRIFITYWEGVGASVVGRAKDYVEPREMLRFIQFAESKGWILPEPVLPRPNFKQMYRKAILACLCGKKSATLLEVVSATTTLGILYRHQGHPQTIQTILDRFVLDEVINKDGENYSIR